MSEENIIIIVATLTIIVLIANPLNPYCIYRVLTVLTRKRIKDNIFFKKCKIILSLAINLILIISSMIVFWIRKPLGEMYNIIIITLYMSFVAFVIAPVSLITWLYKPE